MRVGLSYDLKAAVVLEEAAPDDALEEYDSPTTIEYIRRAIEGLGHAWSNSAAVRNLFGIF